LANRLPETERAIADGQLGIERQAASLDVQEQCFPRLFALAEAVSDRNQLLAAIRRGAHQNQDALAIFFQADVEVHAIGPHVHVVLPFQRSLTPLLEFCLPDFFEAGDRRG
jgi:hypothetical protein